MLKIQVEFIIVSIFIFAKPYTDRKRIMQTDVNRTVLMHDQFFLSFTQRCAVVKCVDSKYIFSVNKIACKFVSSCLANSLVLESFGIFNLFPKFSSGMRT